MDLELSCRCGDLTGRVRAAPPGQVTRCVCTCRDCQTYAHALGAADRVLDALGGTEVVQLSSGRVAFDDPGPLRCLRLTDRGILRWYAGCCDTPVGNTLRTAGLPFVGLVRPFVAPRDEDLGGLPLHARVYRQHAHGEPPRDAGGTPRVLARVGRMLLLSRLRGEQRRSPFFDGTGAPVAEPRILEAEELERARSAAAAPPA